MRFRCCLRFWSVVSIAMASLVAYSEESQNALPPAAAGILTQMDKEVAAAKAKAVVSLEKILKDTTKKGDLAGAVAVKEEIDQLQAELQMGQRQGPVRAGVQAIVGRWWYAGKTAIDFMPDGTIKTDNGLTGTWAKDGPTYVIQWSNGYKNRLSLSVDGLVGTQTTQAGDGETAVRYTRQK